MLRGIGRHGYDGHAVDVGAENRLKFAQAAKADLDTADQAVAFRQGKSENVLFGNSRTGMVGWLNTSVPNRSTYFHPNVGVARYMDNAERRRSQRGEQSRRLNPAAIRKQAEVAKTSTQNPVVAKAALAKAGPPAKSPTAKTASAQNAPSKATPASPAKAAARAGEPSISKASPAAGAPSHSRAASSGTSPGREGPSPGGKSGPSSGRR
jgi:hypothetical protein